MTWIQVRKGVMLHAFKRAALADVLWHKKLSALVQHGQIVTAGSIQQPWTHNGRKVLLDVTRRFISQLAKALRAP
jgi:hypothetical protein